MFSFKCISIIAATVISSLLFQDLTTISHSQELVCPQRAIQQITADPNEISLDPSVNFDGSCVAFESEADLTGQNPDNNREVFLLRRPSGTITQITSDPSEDSDEPSINADCSCIAFVSDADLTGDNPTNEQQIFLYDINGGAFTQITFDPDDPSSEPAINADCTRVAFQSTGDIVGPNIGDNEEVYLYNVLTATTSALTDEPSGSSTKPSINAAGNLIAFESQANINGTNPMGTTEVYLFNTTTGTTQKITNSVLNFGSDDPSIDGLGIRIAFESRSNLNGGNPDGNREVYIFDTTTNILTQITSSTVNGGSRDPSISADGMIVGFESFADLTGMNPDMSLEIFVADISSGVITQVTKEASGSSGDPSLNADGTIVAFESDANINGGNPFTEIDQIWIATCFDPLTARNIPTLSEWGLIATAGVLGIVGLFAIRRRKAAA